MENPEILRHAQPVGLVPMRRAHEPRIPLDEIVIETGLRRLAPEQRLLDGLGRTIARNAGDRGNVDVAGFLIGRW
jgi:hypothetical protein